MTNGLCRNNELPENVCERHCPMGESVDEKRFILPLEEVEHHHRIHVPWLRVRAGT